MVNEHLIEDGETHLREKEKKKKRLNVMEFHRSSELNNSYTFTEKEFAQDSPIFCGQDFKKVLNM